MKILVLVKQVPDSTTNIKIAGDESDIERTGVKMVVNPFDEFAIEQAVRIRESRSDVERITALTIGPSKAADALRTVLAIGADDALHLQDEAFDTLDELQHAALIASVVREAGFDLILAGKQEIDLDSGQIGPALAELLNLPHVGVVTKFALAEDGKSFTANRRIEGADEVVQVSLPALLTCEKGLGEARYPSLPNLMKAKKKPVRIMSQSDVPGFAESAAGHGGSSMDRLAPPPERPPGKMIDGDPEQAAAELARLLREDAKAI